MDSILLGNDYDSVSYDFIYDYNRNKVLLSLYSVNDVDPIWVHNGIMILIYDSFSNDYGMIIELNLLKIFSINVDSDSVSYFRLATKSDDSVAMSVELDSYCFINKISL